MEYHLKLLSPETIKLLGGTKSIITKNKNRKNFPHLEITKVFLVHYNLMNNDYQQDTRVLYTFFSNRYFDQLLDILPKI